MKFKIRDGFICKFVTKVDLGNGTSEQQENTVFGGQTVDLDADSAELHVHKLEPLDKQASAFLDAKVLKVSDTAALGITPELAALAKAMASEMVAQIMAAQAPPAKVAA